MKKIKRYDDIFILKLPKDLKEKTKLKADARCKNVSQYIRDLIIKDIIGDY